MNAYQRKGFKNVTVWVEPELWEAVKLKLAGPPVRSLRSVFIHFLETWTGRKRDINEATGRRDLPQV